MMTKQQILKKLAMNDIEVTFTKADGTERVMKCTSNIPLLPILSVPPAPASETSLKEPKIRKPKSNDIVTVFDTDAHGWRSFNVNSVKEVKDLDTQYGLLQE